jgi:hypothetical protein
MVAPSKPLPPLTPFGYALAGALGGVFSNAVVYPLDTVKTRIQAAVPSEKGKEKDGESSRSILSVLLGMLREEGFWSFYKGFGANMLNTFSQQYAYFFFYSFVRTTYTKRLARNTPAGQKVPAISTAIELLLGAIAGALAQIFTIPVAVIATRQQVGRQNRLAAPPPTNGASSSAQFSAEKTIEEPYDDSFLGIARDIIREDGVTGLWLGIKPGLVLTANPAITYGVFERVKSIATFGNPDIKLGPWKAFLVGALSKTLATVVTYPYIMAKVRIQARTADTKNDDEELLVRHTSANTRSPKSKSGALNILAETYKHQGFVGWYKGMAAQITKAVLSQALLFMSKDQFEVYAQIIMAMYLRLLY